MRGARHPNDRAESERSGLLRSVLLCSEHLTRPACGGSQKHNCSLSSRRLADQRSATPSARMPDISACGAPTRSRSGEVRPEQKSWSHGKRDTPLRKPLWRPSTNLPGIDPTCAFPSHNGTGNKASPVLSAGVLNRASRKKSGTLKAPRLVQTRQGRAWCLSRIEHSAQPGMRSRLISKLT
jgi:hypothetical protein